jgi:hypothetical protein
MENIMVTTLMGITLAAQMLIGIQNAQRAEVCKTMLDNFEIIAKDESFVPDEKEAKNISTGINKYNANCKPF